MGIKVGDMVRLSDGAVGRVEQIRHGWDLGYARVMGTNGVVYKEQPIASLQLVKHGSEPTAPSVSPDIVDRMVRLVRDVASTDAVGDQMHKIIENRMEASRLLRLLPSEPVDPLVLRAREICQREQITDLDYVSGKYDDGPMIRATLRALRDRP